MLRDNVVDEISTIIYVTNDIHNSNNTIVSLEDNGTITVPKIRYASGDNHLGVDFPTDESNDLGHSFVLNFPYADQLKFESNTAPWFGHVMSLQLMQQ